MDAPTPARITLRRRIEWLDTDAAGIYHWTTAFRLAEAAEAALHTALGFEDRTFGATPRVSVRADFKRVLRFNDPVDVTLAVTDVGRTSVRYELTIEHDGALAVAGEITSCLIDRATGRAIPWPEDIRTPLLSAGAQSPDDAS
jgi:acyl-CoA thioester hydrolase